MTLDERELWAQAIVSAMVEEVPMWPKNITKAQWDAQWFYHLWLWELGFRLWP